MRSNCFIFHLLPFMVFRSAVFWQVNATIKVDWRRLLPRKRLWVLITILGRKQKRMRENAGHRAEGLNLGSVSLPRRLVDCSVEPSFERKYFHDRFDDVVERVLQVFYEHHFFNFEWKVHQPDECLPEIAPLQHHLNFVVFSYVWEALQDLVYLLNLNAFQN